MFGRGQDWVWAAWAAPAYGTAAVMLPRFIPTSKAGRPAASVALLTAAFAVAVPLLILLAQRQLAAGMVVISRSAELLARHGTPYLGGSQLSSWMSYNPYLPAMALFGLPGVAGVPGAPGSPQVWMVLATVGALAAAFAVRAEHPVGSCAACRSDVLRYTAFAAACPVLALNLAVTTTDVPVVAFMLLALALAERPERVTAAAAALGLASAMKPTAWPAIPVIALVLWRRDGRRAALRFAGIAAAFVLAATVPAIIADPGAMVANTILFPLGLTTHLTPADSLMPGDLLARSLPSGHAVAAALVALAGVAVAVWLVRRPPRDMRAATWRLALGLALVFALGPAERFGYFVYPLALAGWLLMTKTRRAAAPASGPSASMVRPARSRRWRRSRGSVSPGQGGLAACRSPRISGSPRLRRAFPGRRARSGSASRRWLRDAS